MLLHIWSLNWQPVPSQSSMRYRCARLTRQAYHVVNSFCWCVSGSGYHQSSMFVVDGGTTSGDMASTCDTPPLVQCVGVLYIQKHFCASGYVIFDGYSDGPSSKCMEQGRRERHCKEQYYVYPCIGWARGHWLITWKGLVCKWSIRCRHTYRAHRHLLVTNH